VDLFNKISILGPEAKYDTCGPKDFGDTTSIPGVYHAKVAGGHVCRLFKVLQTNACKNNCNYCALRKDRDCNRTLATPDEMASAFNNVYSRHLVDGLFLSSGITNNPTVTMSRMLDTVHIVRKRYRYKGYVHLKIMPGSPDDCIQESLKVANRVSINLEAPTQENLSVLSPDKDLKTDLFGTLFKVRRQINKLKRFRKRVPSVTTQFVVGAGKESDKDLVSVTDLLYKQFGLGRVFYSAFRPIVDTPLENLPAESITRAHRLYQTDFLMRFYRFNPGDISFDALGYLNQEEDPKMVWAKRHPEAFPVNLNEATYWGLLKVPGIGPESAKKLLAMRRGTRIGSLDTLKGMRLQLTKMKAFVCV
jgi:predicted DNA-binding helix-hairpin-helix protein